MLSRTRKIDLISVHLHAGDARRLRAVLDRLDEVQIAAQLDNLEVPDQIALLQRVNRERRAEVLEAMRYETAAALVAELAPEEAARLLDELEADDAVDILGEIEQEQLEKILSRLDADNADELQELLAYDENTAAGLMSPEAFRCGPDTTVFDALASIRAAEEIPESAFYVYVVEPDGQLVGVCSLRQLLTSTDDRAVRDIMDTEVVTVQADMDQEEVAEVVSRYDLVAVPVVDEHHRLLGLVEVDDVLDVLREEATEDILKMAGAGEQLVDQQSFGTAFRVRSPWLLAAAVGGLIAALSLTSFEGALAAVPTLAFFMPVVAGMGGNVGTQSSTIVVRGLAVGFVGTERVGRLIIREVSLGAALGMLYGMLIASVALYVSGEGVDPAHLGVVIALGTAGSMTVAATVGTCMPLLLNRFNVDPAIATGPFVTTAVDVIGLLLYFWLATVLLDVGP